MFSRRKLNCFHIAGWVNYLNAGQSCGAKGFMFFTVDVDLTEEGIGDLFLVK